MAPMSVTHEPPTRMYSILKRPFTSSRSVPISVPHLGAQRANLGTHLGAEGVEGLVQVVQALVDLLIGGPPAC